MEQQIGPYSITREIGRGGMGVVYQGRDTRLDRDVAIKALPPEMARDPDRLARFEREAKVLAQLSHANVAGIYGLETHGDAQYLVLEFVEGETLADRLDRGPLPIDEALDIAVQIAAGVEAAHDAGVIHRDLKPGNVIVTPAGQAKVLDFGLARADEPSGTMAPTALANSPTITTSTLGQNATQPGVILGTAAYMSPEQARGRRVDKRSDIWSFGVVLYEMLTGLSPFRGETVSDSIGAILHKDIDLDTLPTGTPGNIRRVLERCLMRDKAQRYRDIGDVRIELLRTDEPEPTESGRGSTRRGVPLWAAVAMLLLAVGATIAVTSALQNARPQQQPMVRKLDLVTAPDSSNFSDAGTRISPNGRWVAFKNDDRIHIRDLSSFETRPVAGTEGVRKLFWSPDSQWIGFTTDDGIQKVPSVGGGVSLVTKSKTWTTPTWTDNDRILFSDEGNEISRLASVSARGGTPVSVIECDPETEIDFHEVSAIPGTNIVLLANHTRKGPVNIEAYDGTRRAEVVSGTDLYGSMFAWSPTGHVLFTRGFAGAELWAVPFSLESLETTGEPFLVMERANDPSISRAGALCITRGGSTGGLQLAWITPDGEAEPIAKAEEHLTSPLLSPDGQRIAFVTGKSPPECDVWIRDLERGVNSRVSYLKSFSMPIAWSQDGAEIAVVGWMPAEDPPAQTYFFATDGTGEKRERYPGLIGALNRDWTLGVATTSPQIQENSLYALQLDGFKKLNTIGSGKRLYALRAISPDGSLLLYMSDESGKPQVYCTRFPDGRGRWQVSIDGGATPMWSSDGRWAYYGYDDVLYRVPVTREPDIGFGAAEVVFNEDDLSFELMGDPTPTPDPNRYLAVIRAKEAGKESPQAISIIDNWYEEFRPGD